MDAKSLFGNHWTVEEYFALEANSSERYEYHDGYIIGMSGGTVIHNRISINITRHLYHAAALKGCNTFMADMQFSFSSHRFYYPDVLVTCEPLENNKRIIHHPCFVVEVLSDSTERKDFTTKLTTYMNTPSLKTILYIEQTARLAYVWQRTPEGWEVEEKTDGEIYIPCITAALTFDQIYERVEFGG